MRLKNHIITSMVLVINMAVFSQSGLQKKADNLFNKFSFVDAAHVYKELISKNYNTDYATRQLSDCYAYMRNPDSAVVYYKKVIEQPNVPNQYYYNYAQALRGVKDYKESRVWLKRYKDEGGEINEANFLKDSDFINSIFNAKPQYFLKDVNFNSKYSDFGAYEKDGSLYFASSRDEGVSSKHIYGWNEEPFLDVYVKATSSKDSIVNNKFKLQGAVNTMYHEGPLTMSKDGKTMYFSRNNFNKQVLGKTDEGITNLKIYKAVLVDGKWTNIEELPFNSNTYSIAHPALNSDETKLYFTSDMPGGIGGTDIYYVDIDSNGYGTPKNLGSTVNTNKNESFPFINNEGNLFLASDGHPGLGLLDVFGTVSDENNNIISVINLGTPVNSSKDDFSFFMSEDGLSGYFASNRDGGVGSDDIYAFDRVPPLKIEGTVTDAETNTPIANATVTLLDSNSNPIATLKTDENGYFDINIDRDTDYYIQVKNDAYLDNTIAITSKGINRSVTSINANIALNPDRSKTPIIAELQTIYFDFDRYAIRKDSTLELDRIVNLMNTTHPDMVIKIESHTDSRGTKKYNDILSEERAKATYDYLINKGIDASRISEYKGFGEQKLTNQCDGTIPCTEAQHQLNRRTQFIVIRME
ncbi:outer membrane protein OmpA-like peptidoglycan-associated protein [Mariniflexile fucanivorans]|uniref:Outer membrane protein OmpA-like peptidoglycan-associated protein n=1 Tax=Mariniflexile fucanivorans TaxID=264023 RepID=A0A4R1RGC5_9FLAO|nr:OmpA family protein [Mariniflexile fucanivorans]TCL65058.1 outer membrane protein OmpA-like peptidoglycan-associated protein [Mariniflexile fucanivorans]